jgi:hypothetical protein
MLQVAKALRRFSADYLTKSQHEAILYSSMILTRTVFEKAAPALLEGLDARSRNIITRRHGLESGTVETLESIGKEYGVTRERVRQIEAQAKKLLARRDDILEDVVVELREVFRQYGGVLAENHLFEIINQESAGEIQPALVSFYLSILPGFQYASKSSLFDAHWLHPDLTHQYHQAGLTAAEAFLRKARQPQDEKTVRLAIRQKLNVPGEQLSDRHVHALLRAGKVFRQTVFSEWGLVGWIETRPRGVGDKAYVVLRRHGKPEHFRQVTAMINEAQFDHKQAHAQTVHNELIKDDRFVLVGRGLYGLKEWGFIPGTVAQVLEAILAEASRPLTRDELLERVLKQRMVKRTTVFLGLQNSNRIQKVKDGRYTLR